MNKLIDYGLLAIAAVCGAGALTFGLFPLIWPESYAQGVAVLRHPHAAECRSLGGVVKLDSSLRFAGCLLPPQEHAIAGTKVGP